MNNTQTKLQLPFNVIFKKRMNLILEKKKTVFIFLVAGLVLAAAITFLLPKSFRASSKIFFNNNSFNNELLTNNGTLKNEIDLLTSDKLINMTAELLANEGLAVRTNDIKESIEISENVGSSALSVNIVSDEGVKSAKIANLIISNFQEIALENSKASLILILSKIEEKEKLVQDNLRRGLSSQTGLGIGSLNLQQESIINQIAEFESELEVIELESQFYSHKLMTLESQLDEQFPVLGPRIKLISIEAPNNNMVKLQRFEAESILSEVSRKLDNYKVNFPWTEKYNSKEFTKDSENYYKFLEQEIDKVVANSDVNNLNFLRELSKNTYENRIKLTGIDFAKSAIFNTMSDLEESFTLMPYEVIEVMRTARTKKFNTFLLLKLKSLSQKYRDNEKSFYSEINSIVYATIPDTYFSPNTSLNILIGGIVGLIIGLLLAGTSNSVKIELIKSFEDLEESGYKIVAQIPSFPSGSPVLVDELSLSDEKKMDPQIIKAFSSFETFLKYGSLENPLKTVLVTSGQDGEGKSVIASNIAIALANTGNKVLLVDADLKNPQLHKLFRVKSTPSLAHFLFRKKELNEIVRGTHVKNLDLITCIEFPQNPSVIITSERMTNFMNQVEDKYDYIVYDSASLCSLKETASLAKYIDEVILAVRIDKTKLSEIIGAEAILNEFGVHEFNIVLNDVKN